MENKDEIEQEFADADQVIINSPLHTKPQCDRCSEREPTIGIFENDKANPNFEFVFYGKACEKISKPECSPNLESDTNSGPNDAGERAEKPTDAAHEKPFVEHYGKIDPAFAEEDAFIKKCLSLWSRRSPEEQFCARVNQLVRDQHRLDTPYIAEAQ